MNYKAPTWGILEKRDFVGPGWCCLRQLDEEINSHILMSCPFTKWFWEEVEGVIALKNVWVRNNIDEAFRIWCTHKEIKRFIGVPINVSWGIWLGRILKLSEDKETLYLECVVQELNILYVFP
jgi:hypothetical protein